MLGGFALVLAAALCQGSFLVPMTLTRNWAWEHTWAAFCLFSMLALNWLFSFAFLPNPFSIYVSVPRHDLIMLALFGAGWGVGAILFGLGMERLGLALGYPLIMGLSASAGALVPMVWSPQTNFASVRGLIVIGAVAIAVGGIAVCSIAGARKESSMKVSPASFSSGLLIAVAAGLLCCLPNVGMMFGASAIAAAAALGAPQSSANNVVWCVFFTLGGLVNLTYCALRMVQRGNAKQLIAPYMLRNSSLAAGMALMWMGSFYLYGIGASKMGPWGAIIGWPVLISVSIGVGIAWGLWKGEWTHAPDSARRILIGGLILILAAVLTLAMSNAV
jgi:L-rhamnose-H+ transport protein